jgi:hypothetical protein
MEASEATFIADSVGRIIKNPRYLPKERVRNKKATNKQNREELRRRTGQPSPKEVRLEKEKKLAAELEAKKRAEKEADEQGERGLDFEADEQGERGLNLEAEPVTSASNGACNPSVSQLTNTAPNSKKRSSPYQYSPGSALEDIITKRRHREKTQEELKSEFLARLELLSGRLFRRKISRDTIASHHKHWMKKVRLEHFQ